MRLPPPVGCVLVGDPGYYNRFGFKPVSGLGYDGVLDEYVLALPLKGERPKGAGELHMELRTAAGSPLLPLGKCRA